MSQTITNDAACCCTRSTFNWLVFILSAGFFIVFCMFALGDINLLRDMINASFSWSVEYFGYYWQLLLLATFFIALILALSPAGPIVLGGLSKPEFGWFKWGSMIICTLMAAGGVFWAAGEPLAHFLSPAPLFSAAGGSAQAVAPALEQSFMHWGFLAWAITCTLSTVMLMYYHYERGLPLAPRTLLYPVFGDRVIDGSLGRIVDACAVIAVVAGTIGPVGFLGLQVSYGLHNLFGIPNSFVTQTAVIIALTVLFTLSALSGVNKGVQILSRINVVLAIALLAFMLLVGPTRFIVTNWATGFAGYIKNFVPMAMYRGDSQWLNQWTLFFWGWFIGYGPMMAIFVARISRGRSIRQIMLMVAVIAPIATTIWFAILGGSGIAFELANPGSMAHAFEGNNLPAVLLAITRHMPLGFLISVLFLILSTIFVATTADSMTFSVSRSLTTDAQPPSALRVFWGITIGLVAIILITVGSGGVSALQSFIVVTAVPVSLILLPSLWDAPRIAMRLYRERRTVKNGGH